MRSIEPFPVPNKPGEAGISTLPRFLYLNTYAFLLVFGGIGIACVPVGRLSLWWVLPQGIGVTACWWNAVRIFRSWQDKKRQYRLLSVRNAVAIRPDTFKDFMQAPCGRLLVRIVLKDLGREAAWNDLCRLQLPLRQRLREGCRKQKTIVRITNENI